MKVAVIGCGTIANAAHIPSYMNNPEAEIVYFCDIILERAQKAVAQYGCGRAVTDYHEVLNDPQIEAVSVCTPNNVHAQIAIDALRAGKHVLCEKPAARTYAEALEMQKVQHETGRVLNIGVVNRFNAWAGPLPPRPSPGAGPLSTGACTIWTLSCIAVGIRRSRPSPARPSASWVRT